MLFASRRNAKETRKATRGAAKTTTIQGKEKRAGLEQTMLHRVPVHLHRQYIHVYIYIAHIYVVLASGKNATSGSCNGRGSKFRRNRTKIASVAAATYRPRHAQRVDRERRASVTPLCPAASFTLRSFCFPSPVYFFFLVYFALPSCNLDRHHRPLAEHGPGERNDKDRPDTGTFACRERGKEGNRAK